MTMDRWGSVAALLAAATYLVGFALLVTLIPSFNTADPSAMVDFLAQNHGLMFAWNLTIYVVNAIALVVLAVALSERFRAHSPGLAQLALAFGVLWATLVLGAGMVANVGLAEVVRLHATSPEQAGELWHIVHLIENGLGGGNEIAGGVWALVLGLAGIVTTRLPRLLSGFGLIIGLAGVLTVVPSFSEIGGALFGLGYIAWFIWAGIALLLSPSVDRLQAA